MFYCPEIPALQMTRTSMTVSSKYTHPYSRPEKIDMAVSWIKMEVEDDDKKEEEYASQSKKVSVEDITGAECDTNPCSTSTIPKLEMGREVLIKTYKLPLCEDCGEAFTSSDDFRQHLARHGSRHTQEIPTPPEDALGSGNQDTVKTEESVITEASSQMQSAAGTLGPMAKVQSMCDRTDTSGEYNFSSHRNVSSTGSDECRVCGGHFVNLSRHMRLHEGRKIYECQLCSENFPTKWDLNKHVRAVHPGEASCGQFIYKCEMCPKTFAKKWDLKRHRKLHSKEMSVLGNVKCDCCSRSYATDRNLEAHRKINIFKQGYVHAPKKGNVHGQNGLPVQFKKHCVCYICWKSCRTPYRLKKHMLIHAEKVPAKSYNSEVLKGNLLTQAINHDHNYYYCFW
ncbi:uncharacterized protein [Diadema setosum]|uniref:uncharacterized protein n=1 Tax=Diadema setosum TaxID=31175 RepID=UPI003B3BC19E